MLHIGLGFCRTCLDMHVLDVDGSTVEVTAVSSDAGGLRDLVSGAGEHGDAVMAVVESMNSVQFVHDAPELDGW